MSNILFKHVKENRRDFINELKSGDYKQIQGHYSDGEGKCFCALGLCASKIMGFEVYNFENRETDPSITRLLEKKMQMGEEHAKELVYLNDDTKLNFDKIADSLVGRGFLEKRNYDLSEEYLWELEKPFSVYHHLTLG